MNTENPREKLKEYYEFFHGHEKDKTSVPTACNIAQMFHFAAWIIFLTNLYALTKWQWLANISTIPILKDIPSWMPFYSSNIWIFLLCGIATVYVIPALIGKGIAVAIWNKSNSANQSNSDEIPQINEDILKAFEEIHTKYKPEGPGCTIPALEMLAGIILGFMTGHIGGFLLVVLFTAIEDFIFWCITSNTKLLYETKFEEFTKYKKDIEDREKAKKEEEAEKQRIESERKAQEEKRLAKEAERQRARLETKAAQERRKQQIAEAENQFHSLKNPGADEKLLKDIADKGSPSACLYFGRMLYEKYVTEALTKSEKEKLAVQCKSYLKKPADTGNMEADYLLLAIRTTTESNKLETWLQYLEKARKIKKSGKLPEMYHDSLDSLINSLIEVIDRAEKTREDAKRKPVIKREYCRFLVAGQCSHGGYMSSCRYINNPGSCSTALNHNGYAVEIE